MAGTINIFQLKTIQVYNAQGSISDQNKLKQQVQAASSASIGSCGCCHPDPLLDNLLSPAPAYQTGRLLHFLGHNVIGYALSQSEKNRLFWESMKVFLERNNNIYFKCKQLCVFNTP